VEALLEMAAQRYAQAQEALREGNLGRYQELINEVGDLIDRARQASGGTGSATPTTTPPSTTTTTPPQQT
jgi:hypothetical protein